MLPWPTKTSHLYECEDKGARSEAVTYDMVLSEVLLMVRVC